MPNAIKGEILINVSGVDYPIVYTWDAIANLETAFNESVLIAQEKAHLKIGILRAFLIEGLKGGGKFTGDGLPLAPADLPPITTCANIVQQALVLAYQGPEGLADAQVEDEPAKKAKPKKK
jgi:hypothetical protein